MMGVEAKRASLLVAGIATLMLMASGSACKKRPPTLRDPSLLPHVDRPFPKITTDVPLNDEGTRFLLQCYAVALVRDATEAGILKGIYTRDDRQNATVGLVQIQSGKLDERIRECVQDSAEVTVTDKPVIIVFTLSSTMRHEPLAPGVYAADSVVRVRLARAKAPLVVRGTHLDAPYYDELTDGVRDRSGKLIVDAEVTETGVYEICGGIQDFLPKESNGPPCPKVKHFRGDDINLSAYVSFTLLNGDEGWEDTLGRHWYGDELREVDAK